MNSRNRKISHGQLAASASAVIAFFGGYGRAFAQSTANCALQSDGTAYICSGTATTMQDITLDSTKTKITTAPDFSIDVPFTNATPDAVHISGAGSFIDNNQSSITGGRAIEFLGSGPITITTSGTVTGTKGQGIIARISPGGSGDIAITANNVTAQLAGVIQNAIDAVNNGSGGIAITTSGAVNGNVGAQIGSYDDRHASGNISITASGPVDGAITATNWGTGGISIKSTAGAGGIGAQTHGTAPLTLDISGPSGGGLGGGISASSDNGPISITMSGSVTSNLGIYTETSGAAAIHVTGSGNVNTIASQSFYGSDISITVDGKVSGTAEAASILVFNGLPGSIGTAGAKAGNSSVLVSQNAVIDGGIVIEQQAAGHTDITVAGTINAGNNGDPTINNVLIGTSRDPSSSSEITVAATGKVNAAININTQQLQDIDYVNKPASNYGPAIVTNAGTISGGINSGARTTITNTGTISAASGQTTAINLTGPSAVINLQGGAVNGDIVVAQNNVADGSPTINWTGGTVKGAITLSTQTVTGGAVNYPASINLTNLGEAQLSGLTHIMLANPGELPGSIPLVNLKLDNTLSAVSAHGTDLRL